MTNLQSSDHHGSPARPPSRRRSLRVCLVSDCLAEPCQEGGRVLAHGLATGLGRICEFLAVGTHPTCQPGEGVRWLPQRKAVVRALRTFRPDVVLTYPHASTTIPALLRARRLVQTTKAKVHAFLAYQQRHHTGVGWRVHRLLAPDLILCLSRRMRAQFEDHGLRARQIPCGVDLERFTVPTGAAKRQLRERHGLPLNSQVALHVGHAKPERNLGWMISACRRSGWHGVFVLSRFGPADPAVLDQLTTAAVRVVDGGGAVIEEWYRLADCYLFPVLDSQGCAEIPQSVLEALASGLPVVSTPFGGLPDLFPVGDRIVFAGAEKEFVSALQRLPLEPPRRPVRIEQLSWTSVADEILQVLEEACP